MSEATIIVKTKEPNTVNTISHDLVKLGICTDDILLVHSSLSSLGVGLWWSTNCYTWELAKWKDCTDEEIIDIGLNIASGKIDVKALLEWIIEHS